MSRRAKRLRGIFTGGGRGSTVVNGKIYRKGDAKKSIEENKRNDRINQSKADEVQDAVGSLADETSEEFDVKWTKSEVEKEQNQVQETMKKRFGVTGTVVLDPSTLRWQPTRGGVGPSELIINGKANLDNGVELQVTSVKRNREYLFDFDVIPNPNPLRLWEEKARKKPAHVFDEKEDVYFDWVERKGNWLRSSKVVRIENKQDLKDIINLKDR